MYIWAWPTVRRPQYSFIHGGSHIYQKNVIFLSMMPLIYYYWSVTIWDLYTIWSKNLQVFYYIPLLKSVWYWYLKNSKSQFQMLPTEWNTTSNWRFSSQNLILLIRSEPVQVNSKPKIAEFWHLMRSGLSRTMFKPINFLVKLFKLVFSFSPLKPFDMKD